MITNILKQTDLTPIEKLLLIDIIEFPSMFNYNKTSAEIAASIGVKQKEVKITLDILQERGIIETKVGYRIRNTKLTQEFFNSIK